MGLSFFDLLVIAFIAGVCGAFAARYFGWIKVPFTWFADHVARKELSKLQDELDDLKRELDEMKRKE